jgi:hypothetical protein
MGLKMQQFLAVSRAREDETCYTFGLRHRSGVSILAAYALDLMIA